MKIKNIWAFAIATAISAGAYAQDINVSGTVTDRQGNPLSGAVVAVEGQPDEHVVTDREGHFSMTTEKGTGLLVTTADYSTKHVKASGEIMRIVMNRYDEPVNVGLDLKQTRAEATSATASVSGAKLKERSAFTSSANLFGYLPGLTSLENSSTSTSFFVRGRHSLSGDAPIVLVDGIERSMDYVMPEEIENVTVLKDAAAVAIYGYRGANGVINVTTKRGKYDSREIKFSMDHKFNFQVRRPKFVDAYTYASAYNEAAGYEGSAPFYNAYALNAFKNGTSPFLFPNVDWVDETYKKSASTNLYNLSFRGGGRKFRYFALANLEVDKGFIKHPDMNEGYSTQDKNVRGNLRMNLDIDLSPRTKLVANVYGTLAESGQPGSKNIWALIYGMPSAALPIKAENGMWGGSTVWSGENNPVAQSQAAAYTKTHTRALFADMTLKQDLGAILPGLGGSLRIAYDNRAQYLEDHTKTYNYASDAVTSWTADGQPDQITHYEKSNNESAMGKDSKVRSYNRNFNFIGAITYDQSFGRHDVSSQLRWDYQYTNPSSQKSSSVGDATMSSDEYFRQNVSWYTHYGYDKRYYADLALVASASNILAPGTKWAVSPTVAAAWVISNEKFFRVKAVDLLKLRASFGVINTDNVPSEGPYWETVYGKQSGGYYNFGSSYTKLDEGPNEISSLPVTNAVHEKAFKYNAGLDLRLFNSLDFSFDAYYERRTDIWVTSDGKYSDVLGTPSPQENAGKVNSWGYELGADYNKQFGEVKLNAGASFSFNRTKVINKNEKPQPYENLVTTGHPLGQFFGLKAIGFFKDENEIANSPAQFGTLYPGDVKYEDINGDGKIDDNDVTALGYNTACPEIYYSFNLGAEWRGLGFNLLFQGTDHYSVNLSTTGFYRPLLAKTSLSQYYYDNRWTPENQNALFPRLATSSSTNNYKASSLWLRSAAFLKLRNVEVYYKLPKTVMRKTGFINDARLYVRGIDLLCFDNVDASDPESVGATDPLNRSLVVGLQLGF